MDIVYTDKAKADEDIYNIYCALGWQEFLKLNQQQLSSAMENSFKVIYAYDKDLLVGTGRVVSDGIIDGYLCGLGVLEDYRGIGIGKEISSRLIKCCEENKLHMQLFCKESLVDYYKVMDFQEFAVGMKRGI